MDSNKLIGASAFGLALLLLYNKNKDGGSSTTATTKKYYTGNADYIKSVYPYALAAQKLTSVPAVVNVLISAVESGFGKHAPGNNFHGIKADKSWHGDVSLLKTPECMPTSDTSHFTAEVLSVVPPNGEGAFAACSTKGDYTVWINDKFRKYSSPAGSFLDFAKFLQDNSRYKPAFAFTSDPKQFGTYILTHGYSTAAYVNTYLSLMDMIQKQINEI